MAHNGLLAQARQTSAIGVKQTSSERVQSMPHALEGALASSRLTQAKSTIRKENPGETACSLTKIVGVCFLPTAQRNVPR
jgi:hypothetical protein